MNDRTWVEIADAEPVSLRELGSIDPDARVLVVGRGPRAAAWVAALADRGHEGRTVAVSPVGGCGPAAPGDVGKLADLRERCVLVDRAAVILTARRFSTAWVVELELTGADVPARGGKRERWVFEHVFGLPLGAPTT